MSPALQGVFERLVTANIQILPGAPQNWVLFNRGQYVALVERTHDGLGRVGMGGLLTTTGYAALTWTGNAAFFVAKGGRRLLAADTDIAELRQFQSDLEKAIAG